MSNLKSKHAFGSEANINSALQQGKIDEHDILFLDERKIGWIDKNGNIVMAKTGLEADEVDEKISNATSDNVSSANSYTDSKVKAVLDDFEHSYKKIKYEITNIPEGSLVNYDEKEIRVMCPVDTKWIKQNVGATGNASMYYIGFKAYAPDEAVSFKEGDQGIIIDKMFTFDDDFAGKDEYGRNYSICWLAIASYDESSDTWLYFGKSSSVSKYVGWSYVVEWYDANGILIASDGIRINLSNEECHSSIEPYYIANATNEINEKIDDLTIDLEYMNEQMTNILNAYTVVEF